jgi:hypothetical protein
MPNADRQVSCELLEMTRAVFNNRLHTMLESPWSGLVRVELLGEWVFDSYKTVGAAVG